MLRTPKATPTTAQAAAQVLSPTPARAATAPASLSRQVGGEDRFTFRGRPFRVPPISYALGLELLLIQQRLAALGEEPARRETLADLAATLEEAIALFRRLVRPVALLDRLCWRWLSNPFGNASLGEVAQLIGYFSDCRPRSGVRLPD